MRPPRPDSSTTRQSLVPLTQRRSATPTISVIKEAKDGFEPGDVDIQIDPDLADRLNEFIQRVKGGTCKDGEAFGVKGEAKRGDASFAITPEVVCTTREVIGGARGLFDDLLITDMSKIHLDLSGAVQKGQEALVVLGSFIKAYSPLLAQGSEVTEQLVIMVLLMVYDALVENMPLGAHNRVKSQMVELSDDKQEPSASQTSSGACPKPTEVGVFYGSSSLSSQL